MLSHWPKYAYHYVFQAKSLSIGELYQRSSNMQKKSEIRLPPSPVFFFQMMIGTIYSIGNLVHLGPVLSLIERSKLENPHFYRSQKSTRAGIFLASVT